MAININPTDRNLNQSFERIAGNIYCLHRTPEVWAIANAILSEKRPGPIVECGCFLGGMTAKLSLVCDMTDRDLYVFDSFNGLPHDETAVFYDPGIHEDKKNVKGELKFFYKGEMAVSLENVTNNVRNHGKIERCKFIPGLFCDTLHAVDIYPALVFIDVDLVQSARDCLAYFWPRLKGNYFFTHEMWFKNYVEGITDKKWWNETLNCNPPELVGARYGLGPGADDLGYFSRYNQNIKLL